MLPLVSCFHCPTTFLYPFRNLSMKHCKNLKSKIKAHTAWLHIMWSCAKTNPFICNIMHLRNVVPFAAVGVSPVSRSSPSVPAAPISAQKTPTTPTPTTNPLTSILSRVDINTNTLLSALSKTQTLGGFHGENWKCKIIWGTKKFG